MNLSEPSTLEIHAAIVLAVGYGLSLLYELWRTFGLDSENPHDSVRGFVVQLIPLYTMAAAVIAMLLAGVPGAAWVGLLFSVVFIAVSIVYYNATVMLERLEGPPDQIDWAEDLIYTGLLFVAAALLLYEVVGRVLE